VLQSTSAHASHDDLLADLGLCLGDTGSTERLEASGSFNSMCSHRVRLTSRKDVNAELKRWLNQAYQQS